MSYGDKQEKIIKKFNNLMETERTSCANCLHAQTGDGETIICKQHKAVFKAYSLCLNYESNLLETETVPCDFCGQPSMHGETHCEKCAVLRVV